MVEAYIIFDLIQSLAEIPNLPGIEDDEALEKDINAQIIGYKAYRYVVISDIID